MNEYNFRLCLTKAWFSWTNQFFATNSNHWDCFIYLFFGNRFRQTAFFFSCLPRWAKACFQVMLKDFEKSSICGSSVGLFIHLIPKWPPFSILLLTCKLALVDSFTGKYSDLQVNERILKWRQFWRKVYYIKNKFHVFVGLFSIRSENWQKTSKYGKNWTSVTHSAVSPRIATFSFLPHFDIILDLLLNRRTATWNLFVNCKEG